MVYSAMVDSTIVTIRLPRSFLERADALIPAISADDAFAVSRMSRSVALRLAVLRGLETLEAAAAHRIPKKRTKSG
jgi:hypothetical protein